METPLVSVIMSAYNCKDTALFAVASLTRQSFRDLEILIFDDGSTDGTDLILKSVKDPRVRVFSDGANRGLSERLNQLVDLARGKYIARMDADDMCSRERIEKQIRLMENDSTLDLCDTGIASFGADYRVKGIRGCGVPTRSPQEMLMRGVICHAAVLAKAEYLKSNRYRTDLLRAEDRELWARTWSHLKIGRVQEPLYLCRESDVSVRKFLRSYASERRILRMHGPSLIGMPQTVLLTLRSHCKSVALRFLAIFRAQNWTMSRKLEAVDSPPSKIQSEIDEICALAQTSHATRV